MKELIIDHNHSTIRAINKLHKLRGRSLVVVEKKKYFKGILSNYDIRKSILNNKITNKTINLIYNKQSKFIYSDKLSKKIPSIINKIKKLEILPVIDKKTKKIVDILDYKRIQNISKKNKKKINCDVVIMAGGKGTRLKPYTEILPKPLLPIRSKSLIRHIVERFEKFLPSKFLITMNYKSKLFKTYINELRGEIKTPIKTLLESKPLGTFGGVVLFKNLLSKNFILTNCDTIINYNYYDIFNFHIKNENDLTIVTAKKSLTLPYGLCENNKNNFSFVEKPKYKLNINTGFYIIKKDCLKKIKNGHMDFNKFIEICIKEKKKINFFQINANNWIDVGQRDSFKDNINKKI